MGTALKDLARCTRLNVSGAVTGLAVQGAQAMLSFDVVLPEVAAVDQVGDASMAMFFKLMQSLCGSKWGPLEVRFSHVRPPSIQTYRTFFRAPLRFEAEHNAIVFQAAWLRHPVSSADPELRRLLQVQIDALEETYKNGFAEEVRRVLRSSLLAGHTTEDEVAAHFSMHGRSMRRRLRECGTSYKQLLEQSRYAIALQLLEDSTRKITEIAAVLDYADASAFGRAFRRWSGGLTPSQFRDSRRSGRSL